MFKIVNQKQMKNLDRVTIKKSKNASRLMKNAGLGAFEKICSTYDLGKNESIIIIGGPGNNGGDAWVLAQKAIEEGFKVKIFFWGDEEKLSQESKHFFKKISAPIHRLEKKKDLIELKKELKNAHYLVEALIGLGLSKPVRGLLKDIITILNQADAKKIALDLPVGVCADTGKILGQAFSADLTLTMELPKWGHILEPGSLACGELKVIPIGILKTEVKKIKELAYLSSGKTLRSYLPKRDLSQHKGSFGRSLIVAGSNRMPGAGILASQAVLRSGCGLSTLTMPTGVLSQDLFKSPETILMPLSSKEGHFNEESFADLYPSLNSFKAMGLGPGLGRARETQNFIWDLIDSFNGPMILDADGLILSKEILESFKGKHKKKIILTPHPKEMSYLVKKSTQEVQKHRMKYSQMIAQKWNVICVLKGYRSIIATPQGQVIFNPSGNMTLGTAGSGDVLTGLMTGFLAQGLSPLKAALTSVYVHGKVGNELYHKRGDRGFIASDILNMLPDQIQRLLHFQ